MSICVMWARAKSEYQPLLGAKRLEAGDEGLCAFFECFLMTALGLGAHQKMDETPIDNTVDSGQLLTHPLLSVEYADGRHVVISESRMFYSASANVAVMLWDNGGNLW